MPELGEEINAEDIGKPGGKKKYLWVVCPVCREERWAYKASTLGNKSRLCKKCNIRSAGKRFHL